MLTVKQQAAALGALAFFCIAMLCAESSRLAACDTISIHARATDKPHSPVAGQRKALKRSVFAEEIAPQSDSVRTSARYLTPQERHFDLAFQARQLLSRENIPLPKISTNLFLSVLNL